MHSSFLTGSAFSRMSTFLRKAKKFIRGGYEARQMEKFPPLSPFSSHHLIYYCRLCLAAHQSSDLTGGKWEEEGQGFTCQGAGRGADCPFAYMSPMAHAAKRNDTQKKAGFRFCAVDCSAGPATRSW